MDTVIKKIDQDQYLSKIVSNEIGRNYEYTSNINNALVYRNKGVAREVASYISDVEVLTLKELMRRKTD